MCKAIPTKVKAPVIAEIGITMLDDKKEPGRADTAEAIISVDTDTSPPATIPYTISELEDRFKRSD